MRCWVTRLAWNWRGKRRRLAGRARSRLWQGPETLEPRWLLAAELASSLPPEPPALLAPPLPHQPLPAALPHAGAGPHSLGPPAARLIDHVLTVPGGTETTLQVVFSGERALRVASLRPENLRIVGPAIRPVITGVTVDDPTDGSPRIATYLVAAPGDGWDASHDGAYQVWLLPRQVRDAAGNYAPAKLLGSFAVRIGDLADSSPPSASLRELQPPAGSATRLLFQLLLSDDVAVDRASIGHENLRVRGPDGSDLPVRLFAVMPAGGGNFRATYALDAPGGRWDAAPRGRYEIRLLPEQLADNSGNFAPPATLGSFHVSPAESADTQPPDAVLTAADVTAPGAASHVLTVRYSDDVAVRVADLDGHNLRVSGPGYQVLATFVSVDVGSDGSPRTATYRVPAPGGAWQAGHNGFYAVSLLPFQVADTSGNFAPAARLGGFTVAIDAPIDTSPPRASLLADDLTSPGRLYYAFQVDYSDDQAIDLTSIGDGDLQVTGPGGFDQPARRAHLATDGGRVSVRYRVRPPGGVWNAPLNGTYHVWMQPDRVRDTAGNPVAPGLLGSFTVLLPPAPDTTSPTATLHAADVVLPGPAGHSLTVVYRDDGAVDVSSLADGNLRVLAGLNGLDVTLVRVDPPQSGSAVTATYRVAAPGGRWDAGQNGTYQVWLRAFQVRDTAGNAMPGRLLGSFAVRIGEPPDTTPPSAAATLTDVLLPGSAYQTFHVRYADDRAVDLATIGDGNLRVTGPGGYDRLATRVQAAREGFDPRHVRATYRVAAPGGGVWTAAHNGTYHVHLLPQQVADTRGNFAPGGLLGSFRVELDPAPADSHPQAALTAAPITTAGAGTHCLYVTYSADRPIDVSGLDDGDLRVRGPGGYQAAATFVGLNESRNGSTRTAHYQIPAPAGQWDAGDDGRYEVWLLPLAVGDASRRYAPFGLLGTFTVRIGAETPAAATSPTPDGQVRYDLSDPRFVFQDGHLQLRPGSSLTGDSPLTLQVTVAGAQTPGIDGPLTFSVPLAARPWQNPRDRTDVNQDGSTNPLDALILINRLNADASPLLPLLPYGVAGEAPFLDVNGDGLFTPSDVLLVINALNRS